VLSNRLKRKVAVVTGGDRWIARAIAERLACEDEDVAICYRKNKQGADEVVERITSATKRRAVAFPGGAHISAARSQPYYLDVTHPQANKGEVVLSISRLLNSSTRNF
jgi:NAD(P)-dependent dehydrogenase (short-subunit alcohol dehydrogenase family)